MSEMIDWIAAEAERVEESGVVRRRGRFSHEIVEDLPAHTFPGRSEESEFTTEVWTRRCRDQLKSET